MMHHRHTTIPTYSSPYECGTLPKIEQPVSGGNIASVLCETMNECCIKEPDTFWIDPANMSQCSGPSTHLRTVAIDSTISKRQGKKFNLNSGRSCICTMKPHRLFIVEDEILIAIDLRARLIDLGYTVVGIASTGIAAIKAVQNDPPDLILMDIHLSGDMNGIGAAYEIRKTYNIPIVFLTASLDKDSVSLCQTQESCLCLSKLSDDSELCEAIKQALFAGSVASWTISYIASNVFAVTQSESSTVALQISGMP